MSGFLNSLIARSQGRLPTLLPRPLAPFEQNRNQDSNILRNSLLDVDQVFSTKGNSTPPDVTADVSSQPKQLDDLPTVDRKQPRSYHEHIPEVVGAETVNLIVPQIDAPHTEMAGKGFDQRRAPSPEIDDLQQVANLQRDLIGPMPSVVATSVEVGKKQATKLVADGITKNELKTPASNLSNESLSGDKSVHTGKLHQPAKSSSDAKNVEPSLSPTTLRLGTQSGEAGISSTQPALSTADKATIVEFDLPTRNGARLPPNQIADQLTDGLLKEEVAQMRESATPEAINYQHGRGHEVARAAPFAAKSTTTVDVHIGQIEIIVPTPEAQPVSPSQSQGPRQSQGMSLAEFLSGRD